jgi:hypothetical protein
MIQTNFLALTEPAGQTETAGIAVRRHSILARIISNCDLSDDSSTKETNIASHVKPSGLKTSVDRILAQPRPQSSHLRPKITNGRRRHGSSPTGCLLWRSDPTWVNVAMRRRPAKTTTLKNAHATRSKNAHEECSASQQPTVRTTWLRCACQVVSCQYRTCVCAHRERYPNPAVR